jgi:trehalose synthase
MAPVLAELGVKVIWRCHIGFDHVNAWTEEAWELLRAHLSSCDAFVFSHRSYAPAWVPEDRLSIIPPSIDPFSPKNQMIPDADLPGFLTRMGLATATHGRPAGFTRSDRTRGEVIRTATIVSEGQLDPDGALVIQVSRWDRLKDMPGVMAGFAARVVARADKHGAQLALVGPSVEIWEALPLTARRRIRLITLPMVDVEENAAMVNALQRSAKIIVQKSLVEGFGLTVAEGMWKGKPVIASAVGGIIDQVVPGTGVLLDDPGDLDAYGDALAGLLERPTEMVRLGDNARRHVLREFVGDRHLLQYAALIERLLAMEEP